MSNGGGQFWFHQFIDSNGNPYSGVKVYHTAAGTDTLKNVWTDEGKVTPAANPVVGDSRGMVSFYADGDYKLVIKDSADVTLYTWDNVKITSDTATMWEGNIGTAFPSVTANNLWQLFGLKDASDNLLGVGINTGTEFASLIPGLWTNDSDASTVANRTMILSSTVTLTANTVIPATVAIWPINPGVIVSNGYTLTINGPVVGNPMHQWLSGFTLGTDITFGNNVYGFKSEWVGGTPADDLAIGKGAFKSVTTATECIAIGGNALAAQTSRANGTMYGNVAIGYNALPVFTGYGTVAIGDSVGLSDSHASSFAHVLIGTRAGLGMTDNAGVFPRENTFVGYRAGEDSTHSIDNTYIGAMAGTRCIPTADTTGYNTFVGAYAGMGGTPGCVGISNTIVGAVALYNFTSAYENCGVGRGVLQGTTTGYQNSVIGYYAGAGITTGYQNTCIGYFSGNVSGKQVTTGYRNTFIGTNTGFNNTTQRNYSIALGYNADVAGDNLCVIGGGSQGEHVRVIIGDNAAYGHLTVHQFISDGTNAIPVVYLWQDDVDEPMIEFNGTIGVGNTIEAIGTKTLTTTHFLMVEINGVGVRYMPIGTIA